jgi:hypothetical protein
MKDSLHEPIISEARIRHQIVKGWLVVYGLVPSIFLAPGANTYNSPDFEQDHNSDITTLYLKLDSINQGSTVMCKSKFVNDRKSSI